MKPVLMLLLAVVVGFTIPACEKQEDTVSLSGNTFNIKLGKNKTLMLKLGSFRGNDIVEISKHPVTSFESRILLENSLTYYRFIPMPGYTGVEEAEIRIINSEDTTYNNLKINVN